MIQCESVEIKDKCLFWLWYQIFISIY